MTVCWLLNDPETCKCISGTEIERETAYDRDHRRIEAYRQKETATDGNTAIRDSEKSFEIQTERQTDRQTDRQRQRFS